MNMKNCGGCCAPTVVMSTYPFRRGGRYQCDCCSQMMQPNTAQYPAGGPMQGNAFVVLNNVPFLIDNYKYSYDTKLSVSESVYTRITKRNDPSCLNMTGTLDMTDQIITNAAWNAFLAQVTEADSDELDGLLPIVKSGIKFTMYYHIADGNGGIVFEGNKSVVVQDQHFHFTDVNDYFLTSSKGIIVLNVPQLTYQGVYNFVIDRVEAHVAWIDTSALNTQPMNPYYEFTDNNTKIMMQHDTIDGVVPVGELLIASCECNQAFPFQGNLTTRVKFSFSAFMGNVIAVSDTYPVWHAMFYPTHKMVEELTRDVQTLSVAVTDLQNRVYKLEADNEQLKASGVKQYALGLEIKTGNIVWYTPGTLYQATADYLTAGETAEAALSADVLSGKLLKIVEYTPVDVEVEQPAG